MGHPNQAQCIQDGTDQNHPEGAKAVGCHARENTGKAPHQVLDGDGECKGFAAPVPRLRNRLQPQPEAVADAHGQGHNGGAAEQ